ncbi:MAG: PorV/PorQ family protein [Candidatus Marinimicrobia bacterium]|nr:PorV/PorQ family protein [Candidatus Neomarinimicrobiota bacterium]
MNKMKRSLIIGLALLFAGIGFAQEVDIPADISKVGTHAAQFLKLEVGAKAAALGGAYVAGVDDMSALFWNPAGLAKISQQSFYGTYTSLYAGIQHGYVAFGTQIGRSDYFGVHVTYLNSGEMEVTTLDFPEGSGEFFSVSDLAIGVSYARKLTDRLSVGGTAKFVNETIWRETASTFGFDIGSQFDTGILGIKLGMAITNFSTKFKFDGPDLNIDVDTDPLYEGNPETEARLNTKEWSLPLTFRMGILVDILGPNSDIIKNPTHRVSLSFDANDPLDHFLRFNTGLEYAYNELLAFRAGYHLNYDETTFSAGVGLNLDINSMPLNIDYAIVNYGTLGFINQISIQLGI